jgi:tRNA pseudouridine55 synthase
VTRRGSDSGLQGLLLIDKEPGWTSHDVVAKSRGITGQRRIGHTGTLDPAATGLLVLCMGRATRLVEYMSGHDKRYEGEIALGISTDTDDAEGGVIGECPVPPIDDAQLRELESRFSGALDQVPPAYSAVKVDGKRAYAVARKGGSLDLQPRRVHVYELDLALKAPGRLGIHVRCETGTYVRSLARDIGRALGCGAHLAKLRRTASGPFRVDKAITVATLERASHEGALLHYIRPMDEGVMDSDAVVLANERGYFLASGQTVRVRTEPWRPSERARIYRIDGEFVGMGRVGKDGVVRATRVFAPVNV